MKTFKIEIEETLSMVIDIEASSPQKALDKIQQQYYNSEIVLDADNHSLTNIDLYEINQISNNIDFANFVLQNAEGKLKNLSLEELAKIGFGSINSAINSFKNETI